MEIGYFLIIVLILLIIRHKSKNVSHYKKESGNSYLKTRKNKGQYGEYLTFCKLEKIRCYKKLMTNLYIPKKYGKTIEIDLIMITEKGIYVFESKNYSGWIFGNLEQKYWTQTFKNKKKYNFFNPVWQNNAHINAIKNIMKLYDNNIYKSYIVFSERCMLKNVNVIIPKIKVLKRNNLLEILEKDINKSEKVLSREDVNRIYKKLKKYSCVNENIKIKHIKNLRS